MRKFLWSVPVFFWITQSAFGACDTTVAVSSLSGYKASTASATAVLTPATGLHALIQNCSDSVRTITLSFSDPAHGDTIRLDNELVLDNRSGKTTKLVGKGTGNGPVTFVENVATDPMLIDVKPNNKVELINLGFARATTDPAPNAIGNSSVRIEAKGSRVADCFFWMADNNNPNTPRALLSITGDDVLVERCVFRAPPNGQGRAVAIYTDSSSNKAYGAKRVEIRSNLFYSTGLYFRYGTFHIFANTFAGTRNVYNAIIAGVGIADNPNKSLVIEHNLFAFKIDTLPPVVLAGNPASADSILKNAYSASRPTDFAVNVTGGKVTLNGTSGLKNEVLPRGFSDYGPNKTEFKQYPLTQLRTDSLLSPTASDFGHIPSVYSFAVSPWSPMASIFNDLTSGKLYFPSYPFTPLSGGSWSNASTILVGAFGVLEGNPLPSPVLPAGTGFSVHKSSTDPTKVVVGNLDFDSTYFGKLKTFPKDVMFFFSDTASKLSSNDSTVLKGKVGPNGYIARPYLNLDTVLVVPKEVRSGGDTYVKVLHFNSVGQGPVLSSDAVTVKVSGVPSFPSNNLGVPVIDTTGASTGTFRVTVTNNGPEPIDSIIVVAATSGGSSVDSKTVAAPAQGSATSPITFNLPKGTFVFNAAPVAKLSGVRKVGTATANSAPVSSQFVAGDVIYFSNKTCNSATANGNASNPFCNIDSALAEIKRKQGGTIMVQLTGNPYQNLVIAGTDAFPVTIASDKLPEEEYKDRAVLQGVNQGGWKPAVVITRPNVTLTGFFIEMPVGSTGPALDVKGAGAVVDGNIFRPSTLDGVAGPAVNIDVGSAEMQLINNVIWGYTTSIKVNNSTSATLRIMHNTLANEAAFSNSANTTGITVAGSSFNAVIANNFFSGQTLPIDSTLSGKSPVLDHNVFTVSKPNLFNLSNVGSPDSVPRLPPLNLTTLNGNDYKSGQSGLQTVMENFLECFSFKPCVSLYAGSSANTHGSSITSDVFDKRRDSVYKEVGAYEALHNVTFPRGVLAVNLGAPTASAIPFSVIGKTFNPAESESVFVWWSTDSGSNNFKSTPIANQKHFTMAQLVAGTVTGSATGLEGSRTYYVFAALHDNDALADNPVGYAYKSSAKTPDDLVPGDVLLKPGTPVTTVPSKGTFVSTSPYENQYTTTIVFSDAVDSGVVKNPVFSPPAKEYKNVTLYQSMLQFTLVANVKGLGATGSKLNATATIEMSGDPQVEGQDLFILPAAAGAPPIYVPNWTVTHNGASKTQISVTLTSRDPQLFAFGKLKAVEPGKVQPALADAPFYDFTSPKDSQDIKLSINGSGFNTANPLVLVSLVPAGGMSSATGDLGVLGGKYYNKTLAFAAGFGDLDPELRKNLFYSYYLKARAAESASKVPEGMNKPFTLDSVSLGDFDLATTMGNPPWTSITNDGDLAQAELTIPMTEAFKKRDSHYKASRSQEVVFTIFDGARLSRSRAFIRVKFADNNMYGSEKLEVPVNQWNLFAYPWHEADTGSLARVVGAPKWVEDNMRLMSYKGPGSGAAAFVSYHGGNANGFRFDSGAAAWSGYKDHPYSAVCATGMTLDYKTFSINLQANQWNDVGLPFNFPIRWSDIIDSSGSPTVSAWRYRYNASPKPAWERVAENAVILPWEGLTINPGATPVVLKIPVLDTARSTNGVAKRSASGILWSRRVKAYNPTAMMLLDIGKATRETVYPQAPSIPGQNFRVGLKRMNGEKEENLSQYVQSSEDGWQGHWALQTSVFQGAQGLNLQLETAGKGVPVYLVDAMHKTSVALSADSAAYVSAEDLRNNDYHLVAGDENYLKSVMDGLVPLNAMRLSNYPNPFSGSTYIRYALPAGFGNVEFRMKVRDSRGRLVWEKNVRTGNVLNYLWDGKDMRNSPAPAGFYTLSLEAAVPGKNTFHAVRRLLKM